MKNNDCEVPEYKKLPFWDGDEQKSDKKDNNDDVVRMLRNINENLASIAKELYKLNGNAMKMNDSIRKLNEARRR